jgi:hypothetical protein
VFSGIFNNKSRANLYILDTFLEAVPRGRGGGVLILTNLASIDSKFKNLDGHDIFKTKNGHFHG